MSKPPTHVDIFFHKDYEGGYAWFFPKGRTANVGLGVVPSKTAHLSDLLNDFLKNLEEVKKVSRIEILSRTGGSIPCEPRRQTLFGNILLVGDAAGHAHPITGAGILNAVIGGEMAGRIAAEAVARGDPRYLENYEIEWRETFGESLSYGSFKRGVLEENWNKREVSFESLIKKTWVSFREYSHERRSASWKREEVLNTSRLV
jgi:flavin-dependent dehydrogenase